MISRFFIDRPVFATVISIVIVLAGLASLNTLPIAQYPSIIPPEVSVKTMYPGASAEVIASTVAAPLEQQINGVDRMIYMRSSSSNGQLNLSVTFEIGTDPDKAETDVNNRVQSALAKLPVEVRLQGVVAKKSSSSILQLVTMYSSSDKYDPIFVSNYALLNVIDDLKRVPGVGDAQIFGGKDYSMRVWLKPDMLSFYNMTPSDIVSAIQEQNSQFAAGQISQQPMTDPQSFTYSITTKGRFSSPEEFENIILRSSSDGTSLKLRDVARVELGALDYSFAASFNGNPSIAIAVYLKPGANAISTTISVREKMIELSKNFPEGIEYALPFDTTKFVKISIEEVVKTFSEAIILVLLVVYLFLQNFRATLIPLLAVPVSLIGTFCGMYLLGFSINLLTLFGMVLAIGIVVDDAIVVLENVERIMRTEKIDAYQASIKAMKEVTGPIIAIVLVLCAVFIPVAFMEGLTGEMYKQFAITIAVSVVISGFVALTLTPALCAKFINHNEEKPYKFLVKFNSWFDCLTQKYLNVVAFLIDHVKISLCFFSIIVLSVGILLHSIPTSLVPDEDQGYVIVMPILLPGSALNRTMAVTDEMTKRIKQHPAVVDVVTFAGLDLLSLSLKSSAGVSFVTLKEWSQRTDPAHDARALTGVFMGMGADIKDAIILAFNPPGITGISMTGGFETFLQNRSGENIAGLAAMTNKIIEAANKRPELKGVKTTLSVGVPQYLLTLDRAKAKALNIPINSIFAVMQSTFGSYYVNDFTLLGRNFTVNLQAEAKYRDNLNDLQKVFVRSSDGNMVALQSLVKMERILGADLIERFNAFPSAKIMGDPAPGFSSGQALAAMEEVVANVAGKGYSLGWTGTAYQEKVATGKGTIAFTFGIIMVFLILAAQYERWALPLAVVSSVPFAIFGALAAIWLRGLNNDVYFQIGLITLIGLSAKNAILIVEFAVIQRDLGLSTKDSALMAAKLRFRPIIMTSLAFILGCAPLVISTGAGSASRHSIGTGVIGGMLAATFLATFFIPLFYKLVSDMSDKKQP